MGEESVVGSEESVKAFSHYYYYFLAFVSIIVKRRGARDRGGALIEERGKVEREREVDAFRKAGEALSSSPAPCAAAAAAALQNHHTAYFWRRSIVA